MYTGLFFKNVKSSEHATDWLLVFVDVARRCRMNKSNVMPKTQKQWRRIATSHLANVRKGKENWQQIDKYKRINQFSYVFIYVKSSEQWKRQRTFLLCILKQFDIQYRYMDLFICLYLYIHLTILRRVFALYIFTH